MPRTSSAIRKTLRLVCWKQADAEHHATELRRAGYRLVADPLANPGGAVRYFRELNPDAVVIDLDRLPSHGRELGMSLRASKSTCHLPLIFAGGITEKIEPIRTAIPGAIFTEWNNIAAAITRAMAQSPATRLPSRELPKPTGAGALERRLNIKPQTHFAVVASDGDASWLKELLTSVPVGAIAQRGIDSSTTLALFVVSMRPGLATAFRLAQKRLPSQASFWIIHPKQTSPLAADFNQDDVRKAGLAQGFVDYKVCAVDKDWSALKFARRGTTKAKRHVMRRA
jgi:DNA-binding NarL/FixJ family response regulator